MLLPSDTWQILYAPKQEQGILLTADETTIKEKYISGYNLACAWERIPDLESTPYNEQQHDNYISEYGDNISLPFMNIDCLCLIPAILTPCCISDRVFMHFILTEGDSHKLLSWTGSDLIERFPIKRQKKPINKHITFSCVTHSQAKRASFFISSDEKTIEKKLKEGELLICTWRQNIKNALSILSEDHQLEYLLYIMRDVTMPDMPDQTLKFLPFLFSPLYYNGETEAPILESGNIVEDFKIYKTSGQKPEIAIIEGGKK